MHKTLYVLFPWDSNEKPWSHAINILEQNGLALTGLMMSM